MTVFQTLIFGVDGRDDPLLARRIGITRPGDSLGATGVSSMAFLWLSSSTPIPTIHLAGVSMGPVFVQLEKMA